MYVSEAGTRKMSSSDEEETIRVTIELLDEIFDEIEGDRLTDAFRRVCWLLRIGNE